MKKTTGKFGNIFKAFVFSASCFFLILISSCGLDVVYYLDPPTSAGYTANYSNLDSLYDYFCFYTKETNQSDGTLTFSGTAVYYKIYNNYSSLSTVTSSISSILNSTTSSVSSFEKLTDSYKYVQLKVSEGSLEPLITGADSDRYVYIRLTDSNDDDLQACICVNSASVSNWNKQSYNSTAALKTSSGTVIEPRRSIDSNCSFNFGGSTEDYNKIPAEGDDDVSYSSTFTAENTWYVDLYAVSVGLDTETFTNTYSDVLHLGTVTIKESEN